MQVATLNGKVVLVGNGLPQQWNGASLVVYDLTPEQEASYAVLPDGRTDTYFDGLAFVAGQ